MVERESTVAVSGQACGIWYSSCHTGSGLGLLHDSDMVRNVWIAVSNAVIGSSQGSSLSSSRSVDQREGGHLFTAVAQHWIVQVGRHKYQAGTCDGLNPADSTPASRSLDGCSKAGETSKTDEEIQVFIEWWNKHGGGAKEYNLVTNSCQTFAVHFVHFLCGGNGKIPQPAGVQFAATREHFVASAGLGEVAAVSHGGGAKVALSAPNAGVHAIRGQGGFVQAEAFKAEAGTDTPLGRVGAHFSPNLNTGGGVRNGNLEVRGPEM
ncbi:unnamed protein product [Prorocentrum cordatum]|uniref:PPPDE domain-containing protein n=1 Tax=Prorocentrum cordatum TaxID=2364126 RepID=A0ABN9PXP9_9DINO|nr:unnamed protein product [Polarella glacialis]